MKKIKNFLEKYKFWILVATGFGILLDVFVFKQTSDLVVLFLTGLWVLTVRLCKFENKVSIAGSLIFLTICPFLLIFEKQPVAEKAAVWFYVFLIVGIFQGVFTKARGK